VDFKLLTQSVTYLYICVAVTQPAVLSDLSLYRRHQLAIISKLTAMPVVIRLAVVATDQRWPVHSAGMRLTMHAAALGQ